MPLLWPDILGALAKACHCSFAHNPARFAKACLCSASHLALVTLADRCTFSSVIDEDKLNLFAVHGSVASHAANFAAIRSLIKLSPYLALRMVEEGAQHPLLKQAVNDLTKTIRALSQGRSSDLAILAWETISHSTILSSSVPCYLPQAESRTITRASAAHNDGPYQDRTAARNRL